MTLKYEPEKCDYCRAAAEFCNEQIHSTLVGIYNDSFLDEQSVQLEKQLNDLRDAFRSIHIISGRHV